MSTPSPPVPFRTKLALVTAVISVVPVVIVGLLLLDVNADAVRTNSRELQLAVADDVSRAFESTLSAGADALDSVARAVTQDELSDAQVESALLAIVGGREAVDHVALYDREGVLIDVAFEHGATRPTVPQQLDAGTMEDSVNDGLAVGEPIASTGAPRVSLTVPISIDGATTGYGLTLISLLPLQQRVERLHDVRFSGLPNSLFVVDEELRAIAHPQREQILRSFRDEGILAGIDPGALTARFQQSGEFVEGDEPMLGSVVGMQTRPWSVVVQIPQRVAYASLQRMQTIVITTLVIVILVALFVALVVAKRITKPISILSDFARDIAERRFDRRVQLKTRDELAVLGDVMSSAAADLQESETRIRKEVAIRTDLGRYLPAELVDKVVKREADMGLGGSKCDVTILFADVVEFTPLTDRLQPEDAVALLNELFTILTEIVFKHGGTIDKFVGDCVMAMWGAPTPQADHAGRALAAAEDMLTWLETSNAGWRQRYGVSVQLAIGVHSGEAVVGNIGSESRMEFTAIGDTVNVAARLESIARPMQVLTTVQTARSADEFEFRDLGTRTLTGRAVPIHLFELVL